MIEVSTTNTIILRDMILGETYEVFHNCVSIATGTASTINTDLTLNIQVENGVYQVVQPSLSYNQFIYNDECSVFEQFSKELYYYWVALNLGASCPEQYTKLCTIYAEFENQLKEECHDCM